MIITPQELRALGKSFENEFPVRGGQIVLAAIQMEKQEAVIKASKSLMDTFDEFGNFNYSSEYIDALIQALQELEKAG